MKTPETIMDGYNFAAFTEQQKSDYAEYGLLPGGPILTHIGKFSWTPR